MIVRLSLALMSVLVLAAIAPSILVAQEDGDLIRLQEYNIEMLNKLAKATVAIHCEIEGRKSTEPRIPRRGQMRRQQSGGSYFGSGVLISADGYVLTSTSVVPAKAKNIKVYFDDGTVKEADLVGVEERNNVALIKIDGSGMTHLKLGSSGDAKTGDVAFTLGNPYDCIMNDRQVAFSMGVISGIYRLRGDGDYSGRVIETDAALNSGSDGGPLVNAKGELIGLMNLSYSYTKWLNTAVPIDQIKLILEDIKDGSVIYPRYGLSIADETEPSGGVAVTKVSRGSPARNGGLRRGDIILEIDNLRINHPDELAEELTILPPGSELAFLIIRNEEEKIIKIISDKFVQKQEKKEPEPEPEPKVPGTIGLSISEDQGVLQVTKLIPGGAAEDAGIIAEDIIVEIDGNSVATLDDIAGILKDRFAGDKLTVVVERGGERKEIEITLKKKE